MDNGSTVPFVAAIILVVVIIGFVAYLLGTAAGS